MSSPSSINATTPALHPRLRDPAVVAALRERWRDGRSLRIADVLRPGLAAALADAAMGHAFQHFDRHVNEVRGVFFRQHHPWPAPGSAPAFEALGDAHRLFRDELPVLVSAITGRALRWTDSDGLVIDCYAKGSYLDAHTDQGADRLIAYVLGLTRQPLGPDDGGQLEFLAADGSVIERRAPGFDTLDLFCIYPLLRPHRVSLVTRPAQRLSVNGWLTAG